MNYFVKKLSPFWYLISTTLSHFLVHVIIFAPDRPHPGHYNSSPYCGRFYADLGTDDAVVDGDDDDVHDGYYDYYVIVINFLSSSSNIIYYYYYYYIIIIIIIITMRTRNIMTIKATD